MCSVSRVVRSTEVVEREVGTQEGLEIPSYQYTYDPTEFPLTERSFSEEERLNPTCARHRYDGMRSGTKGLRIAF